MIDYDGFLTKIRDLRTEVGYLRSVIKANRMCGATPEQEPLKFEDIAKPIRIDTNLDEVRLPRRCMVRFTLAAAYGSLAIGCYGIVHSQGGNGISFTYSDYGTHPHYKDPAMVMDVVSNALKIVHNEVDLKVNARAFEDNNE